MHIKPPQKGHMVLRADSSSLTFESSFDLILTSPPYFHPLKENATFGDSAKTKDLDEYSRYVASILANSWRGLKKGKFLCVVKTDIWFRGQFLPIGYRIVNECEQQGLTLHAHWIWEKFPYYSPYSPSFANIFIFCQPPIPRISHRSIITNAHIKKRHGYPTTFAPEIFEILIDVFSDPNEVVLDPFWGTGSVTKAAATKGRRSVGVEISDVQINRAKEFLAGYCIDWSES